jgi:quinol monooxygenase YgiN
MSGPFIYIYSVRVKEGKLEEYKRLYNQALEVFKAREPRLIAYHAFFNEDANEATIIETHSDAASGDWHTEVLREIGDTYNSVFELVVEIKRVEYYGTPSQAFLEWDRSIPGIKLAMHPVYLGGFTRFTTD